MQGKKSLVHRWMRRVQEKKRLVQGKKCRVQRKMGLVQRVAGGTEGCRIRMAGGMTGECGPMAPVALNCPAGAADTTGAAGRSV